MRAYEENMLDRPDAIPDEPRCVVCGRWGATNRHHVIPKGMGGRNEINEKRIPKWLLCGNGNIDGCHGKFHKLLLHARWHGGWQVKETEEPTNHLKAIMEDEGWKPLRGWHEKQG